MGKRKAGPKRKWRSNKKPKENVWRPKEDVIRESPLFEEYYKLQKIVPEEEWSAFIDCLKTDLPTTFRINEADPNYEIIKKNLKTKYHFDGTVEYEGQQISCVHPIEWYENEGAWQIDVHRKKLRKIEAFKELHQYMIALTLSGHIGRQEAVSMLPPMFLDVNKDDIVLDMCAAPGSKTLQILEKVHRSEGNGIVIANDADSKRSYLLVHQTSHLMSNHIIVTTHLGQLFPFLRFDDMVLSNDPTVCQSGVFDRILCDVPCSGDGTLRKAPDMWMKWNIRAALTLHPLQLAITLQGLKLLKVGGRLVYSTCSFNPLEDEAVVMALMKRCRGAVRIVDVADRYPKLRRAMGLRTWKVTDMENHVYESFESIPEEGRKLYRETMFPPSEEACREAHIERAMRFLPHHQNTGGFFVCVLEKVREIPRSEKEEKEMEKEEEKEEVKEEEKKEVMEEEKKEEKKEEKEEEEDEVDGDLRGLVDEGQSTAEQFHNAMIPWNKEGLEQIKQFYGISDDFDWDLLYSRSASHRVLLCVNPVINKLCITSKAARKLKIVNTGLKVFEFNTRRGECSYRVCQDGLSIIRKYMTKRVYPVCLKDFLRVLETQKKSALMADFSEATQARLKDEQIGACVFELDEEGKKSLSAKWPSFKHYFDEMCCCVWRGDKW